jgi:hypothetical protein
LLNGALAGKNAGLTVDYTQVNYHFTDSIYFKGDTILFDQISIRDPAGTGESLTALLFIRIFRTCSTICHIIPKLLAMNTSARDNSQFFGQVVANGRFEITGRGRKCKPFRFGNNLGRELM